jgi:hypothetical protein
MAYVYKVACLGNRWINGANFRLWQDKTLLERIPAKNLSFEPLPFDCAQGKGNDERAEHSRSQRVYSFGETT